MLNILIGSHVEPVATGKHIWVDSVWDHIPKQVIELSFTIQRDHFLGSIPDIRSECTLSNTITQSQLVEGVEHLWSVQQSPCYISVPGYECRPQNHREWCCSSTPVQTQKVYTVYINTSTSTQLLVIVPHKSLQVIQVWCRFNIPWISKTKRTLYWYEIYAIILQFPCSKTTVSTVKFPVRLRWNFCELWFDSSSAVDILEIPTQLYCLGHR